MSSTFGINILFLEWSKQLTLVFYSFFCSFWEIICCFELAQLVKTWFLWVLESHIHVLFYFSVYKFSYPLPDEKMTMGIWWSKTVDHELSWLTMIDHGFDHGQPYTDHGKKSWPWMTMVITNWPLLTMVNRTLTMVNHTLTMVKICLPWLTMLTPWSAMVIILTMVDHGQRLTMVDSYLPLEMSFCQYFFF